MSKRQTAHNIASTWDAGRTTIPAAAISLPPPKHIQIAWPNILKMMHYRGYDVDLRTPFQSIMLIDRLRGHDCHHPATPQSTLDSIVMDDNTSATSTLPTPNGLVSYTSHDDSATHHKVIPGVTKDAIMMQHPSVVSPLLADRNTIITTHKQQHLSRVQRDAVTLFCTLGEKVDIDTARQFLQSMKIKEEPLHHHHEQCTSQPNDADRGSNTKPTRDAMYTVDASVCDVRTDNGDAKGGRDNIQTRTLSTNKLVKSTSSTTHVANNKSCVTHSYKTRHVILFYQDAVTPSAKKLFEHGPIRFEFFSYRQFYYCLVEYNTCPKHVLLDEHTAEQLMKRQKLTDKNLPRTYTSSPLAAYYDMKPGQILVFLRQYPNHEPHLYLRRCFQG